METPTRPWRNTLGNVRFTPRAMAQPMSARELPTLVRDAERRGGRLHAVGSGMSFTDILTADDVFVSTRGLTSHEPPRARTLRDGVDPRGLVEADAGVTLDALARSLFEEGRSLDNLPGCLHQTVVGAAATATHGSGLRLGSLADDVVAMELVAQGGERVRLEPDDGPTDPDRHDAREGLTLVQRSDLFDAARVHLGVFGVVTRVCLRVRGALWLHERRTRTRWSEVRDTLPSLARAHRHVEVWVDPDGDDPPCLVTARDPSTPARTPEAWHRRAQEELITRPAVGAALVAVGNRARGVFRHARRASFAWLGDRERTGPAHEILDLGRPNRVPTAACEFAVSLADAAAAAEAVLAVYARLRARGRHGPSLPFSLRFVAPSAALLSPAWGRETVTLEVPNFRGTDLAEEAVRLIDEALAPFAARPHWSQLHRDRDARALRALYPRLDAWQSARAQLAGSGVFDSPFTDRLGLSFRARSTRATPPLAAMNPAIERTLAGRRPLAIDRDAWRPARREVVRFTVSAPPADVARALEDVLTEPGAAFGLIRVRRQSARVGAPFETGERFQGCFSLADAAREGLDALGVRTPTLDRALDTRLARALFDRLEAAAFSDFGELTEAVRSPAPGAPWRFSYRYLEGTPLAGRSVYEITAQGDGARVAHEFEYQEVDAMALFAVQCAALKEHVRTVEAQVERAAARLGAAVRVDRVGASEVTP